MAGRSRRRYAQEVTWAWSWEDDEEARGAAALLSRAGVPARVRATDTGYVVEVAEAFAEQAERHRETLLRRYVRRDDEARGRALHRRQTWGTRVLLASALGLGVLVFVALG